MHLLHGTDGEQDARGVAPREDRVAQGVLHADGALVLVDDVVHALVEADLVHDRPERVGAHVGPEADPPDGHAEPVLCLGGWVGVWVDGRAGRSVGSHVV